MEQGTNEGYSRLYHKDYENSMFDETHKFCKREIFIDLMYLAWRYPDKTHEFELRGIKIVQHYGEVAESLKFFSQRYNRSITYISNTFKQLEKCGLIQVSTSNLISIIKIVRMQNGTQNGIQNGKQENNDFQKVNDVFADSQSMQKNVFQESENSTPNKNDKIDKNDNLILTPLNSIITREGKFENSCLERNLQKVENDPTFWNRLQQEYNIEKRYLERKFDNFCTEQMQKETIYKKPSEVETHFKSWLNVILKKCYGAEIYKTFKDFKSDPKELKNPMRLLTPKQKKEIVTELNSSTGDLELILTSYFNQVDDYRFTDFKEEKDKLFQYIASEPQNLPF